MGSEVTALEASASQSISLLLEELEKCAWNSLYIRGTARFCLNPEDLRTDDVMLVIRQISMDHADERRLS